MERKEVETAAQQGGGAQPVDGCQSKKVNDSTMLAPPPPHVSSKLPARLQKEASGPGKRGAERKRGMSVGVWILPEVCGLGIFMIINTRVGTIGRAGDSLYPSDIPHYRFLNRVK